MHYGQSLLAVVFDDHKMFSETFSALLEKCGMFRYVFAFSEEKELSQFFKKNSVQRDVYLFIDYYLSDKHAIPIINNVRRMNKGVKVIVVTSSVNPASVRNILSYEPNGFLSKSSGYGETLKCIEAVKNNEIYICPFISELIAQIPPANSSPFTAREIEVLQYFDQGLTVLETAEKMNLSKFTVVEHRRHMMVKANCNSIVELLAFSRKKGII